MKMMSQGSSRSLLLLICSIGLLGCSLGCSLHRGHKKPTGCGLRNVGGIVSTTTTTSETTQANHDHDAAFGEFPWTVALLNHTDNKYISSGSLIHPQVVMTTGICVHLGKLEEILVRAGEWNLEETNELHEYQERSVESIIKHPQSDKELVFALLILKEPFVLDKHINVVCLPGQNAQPAPQTSCLETSWDRDISPIMQKFALPIVEADECERRLSEQMEAKFILDKSNLCAGGEGVKTHDGGSPLVCPIGTPSENRYQQSGIASWSVLNTDGMVPMGYVNVAMLRDWIDEQMEAKGFGITSYTIP